jgi:hypothetical protein
MLKENAEMTADVFRSKRLWVRQNFYPYEMVTRVEDIIQEQRNQQHSKSESRSITLNEEGFLNVLELNHLERDVALH